MDFPFENCLQVGKVHRIESSLNNAHSVILYWDLFNGYVKETLIRREGKPFINGWQRHSRTENPPICPSTRPCMHKPYLFAAFTGNFSPLFGGFFLVVFKIISPPINPITCTDVCNILNTNRINTDQFNY